MHATLVMTVVGADRPGLVELLASLVAEHTGNWLESRLAHLGGQFAGMVRIELPQDKEESLVTALKSLETKGLTVVVVKDRTAAAASGTRAMTLEIVGQDRPGIVRQISRALASHSVNVEEIETEIESAPMTGETLFKARAHLNVPPQCNLAELRKELEKIAADLIVDVAFVEL